MWASIYITNMVIIISLTMVISLSLPKLIVKDQMKVYIYNQVCWVNVWYYFKTNFISLQIFSVIIIWLTQCHKNINCERISLT